ncbi:MAG: acyltransferase family protein [Butyrivibrio sp.]|nr:acyltransferase family protein [Butyrivibrio sp.]
MKKISTKPRTEYIDIARGIVIILMLIGHSGAPDIITTLIYGFHMPFFFILSGFLYNREKWEEKGLKNLVVSKFKAYIIPYFVLCGINIGLELIYDLMSGYSFEDFSQEGVRSILWALYSYSTKARMGTSVPLWFLPCIFLSTIVVWAVFKLRSRAARCLMLMAFWGVNLILGALKSPILPWHIGIALIGAGFMMAGYYIRKVLDNKDVSKVMSGNPHFYVGFMCFLFSVFFLCTAATGKVDINLRKFGTYPGLFIIGSTCMSVFVLLLSRDVIGSNRVLKFFGRNTIVLMGFNYTINYYSKIFWQKSILRGIVSYNWIVVCILDIVCCAVLIKIKKRIDMHKALSIAS